jgi:hypothetical protein
MMSSSGGIHYDPAFLERARQDPIKAVLDLCSLLPHRPDPAGRWSDSQHDHFSAAYALVTSLIRNGLIQVTYQVPISGNVKTDCDELIVYFARLKKQFQAEAKKRQFERQQSLFTEELGGGFLYEITPSDLERLQTLLDECRALITASDRFGPDHKRRLLRRLERLQAELHKSVSDLDRFWALVGEAGVALGKFGRDAKPLVDRIREITGIVWRSQARAEDLPGSTPLPLLERDDDATG